VPPLIEQVLRRGMSLDPELRFPSMAELLAALVIDPRHDPAGAPRPLRRYSVILLSGLSLLVLGLLLKGRFHKASGAELLGVAVFMLLVVLGAGWILRRSLRQNSFHRGMARLVLLTAVQLFVVRLVALIAGLSTPQTIAMDFAAIISIGTLMSWDYTPVAWPIPIGCLILSIVVACFPDYALLLGGMFLPACAIGYLLSWNRAVRRRSLRAQQSSQPGPR
jgi:hypothetical protein